LKIYHRHETLAPTRLTGLNLRIIANPGSAKSVKLELQTRTAAAGNKKPRRTGVFFNLLRVYAA
jgi:hypothetical protein